MTDTLDEGFKSLQVDLHDNDLKLKKEGTTHSENEFVKKSAQSLSIAYIILCYIKLYYGHYRR